MTRTRALIIATGIALMAACGGSGGSSGGSTTPPPSGGGGGTTPTNPCNTALLADQAEAPEVGLVAGGANPSVTDKKPLIDGDPRGRALEALWLHRAADEQRARNRRTDETAGGAAITSPGRVTEDIGNIAVVQDTGDIIAPANTFDLRGTGLRFTKSGDGYSVTKIDNNFRTTLGRQLTLGDDDSVNVASLFDVPFYGTTTKNAFVNSDGNVTFNEEDKSSTERNVSRLLTGPPRVSPFLSDLDPTIGGKIFVNAAADQYTVTWCAVRGFDSTRTTTVQVALFPDGAIEMKYGDAINLGDAVIGLSPGRIGDFVTMDLSTTTPSSAGNVAMGERFAQSGSLDTVAVGQKYFSSHADNFDQILIWTDQPTLTGGTFAYETTVANEIRGIGQDVYDLSRDFGSGGRLRSVVVMDYLTKYPTDPTTKFLGENNTLSVLGQEVGHRWLAYVNFKDHTGARSDALLGRDLAHWSFFFNSDASVMEGNEIEDLKGGQFRTTDAVKRYSRLDQYMMGLIGANQVPPFWYVESPVSTKVRGDAPSIGVSFTGTRRDVPIDDVIAIHGARNPSVQDSPKTFRQAFIYIVTNGRSADSGQVSKLDTIRRQWETFFRQATDNRMTPNTSLR